MYCETGTVRNCIIVSNVAYQAGGVVCGPGAVVERCTITRNLGENDTGGARCHGGRIENCVITANSGGGLGGLGCGAGAVLNSVVTENRALNVAGGVGGVSLWGSGLIQNCTVVRNRADLVGGLSLSGTYGAVVRNTVIFDNDPVNHVSTDGSYEYCCTFPSPPGLGNITHDPQLTPSYRLKGTSPCIDAGAVSNAPPADIDGEVRWDHPLYSNGLWIADIGADEFVDADLDEMADCWETNWWGSVTNRDGAGDGDADELSDSGEYNRGTCPTNADSNADQIPDGWEVRHVLDPLIDDAALDPDNDGMPSGGEYVADTDPRGPASLLSVLSLQPEWGGMRINWKGGREAWQFLECRQDLVSTGETWIPILAVPPPTPATNAIVDLGATNRTLFYRLRAAR